MRKRVGIGQQPRRIVILSVFVGLAIGVVWSGVVMASSAQPSDEGVNVDLATVETVGVGTDAQGVVWTLVGYRSDAGGCVDLEGELNGERVSFGGCDPDPDALRSPSVGGVVVGGERLAVAFGMLPSSGVKVRAVLTDGTTVDAQVASGAWVVSIPTQDIEAALFEGFDVLDARGAVVESVVVDSLLSSGTATDDHGS